MQTPGRASLSRKKEASAYEGPLALKCMTLDEAVGNAVTKELCKVLAKDLDTYRSFSILMRWR